MTRAPILFLALIALALAAAPAQASSTQLSSLQDDRELLGGSGRDPAVVMDEIAELGVDVIRTNVIYGKVYRTPRDRRKPADFRTSDPNNRHYDWSAYDRLVDLARAKGIRVLLTITGPGPFFSSDQPSRCRALPCNWKPNVSEFGGFAAAAAKHFRGRASYYSIWNEPNIGKTWLTPRYARARGVGRYDYAAAKYRKLYLAGQAAIAKNDLARRGRVLFGEVPSIATPIPFIRATLCLDPAGRPFRGARARVQGCGGRVKRVPTAGFAIHPYNQGALFGPQQRYKSKTSLTQAHLPRLHRLLDGAVRRGRIARGSRGVYITEFGYQSNPPDRIRGAPSLPLQARYINESDRLFFGDPRVKWVNQYELTDVPQRDQFNTGLKLVNDRAKPALAAYRMPIVVTRRSATLVEVYGQVRPGGSSTVAIQAQASGGSFTTVRSVRTNGRGFFRVNVRRSRAFRLKWRLSGVSAVTGRPITSRTAVAGKPLRYYRD